MENKEINMLYNWSAQNTANYSYPKVNKNAGSCFAERDGDEYIKEYGFETIAELKKKLTDMWSGNMSMEKIIKPVAVAAMKNQPQGIENSKKTEGLDEFIYIF